MRYQPRWATVLYALLILLASCVVLVPVESADASPTCTGNTTSGHCYSEFEWDNSPNVGNWSVHVSAKCLADDPRFYGFATQELWVNTDNEGTPGPYWIEQGMAVGAPLSQGLLYWFWADSRVGGGYYEHDLTNLSIGLSTDYPEGIHRHDASTWYLERTPEGIVGTSTSNTGNSYGAQVGMEYVLPQKPGVGQVGDGGMASAINMEYILSGQTTNNLTWPGAYSRVVNATVAGSVANGYANWTSQYWAGLDGNGRYSSC